MAYELGTAFYNNPHAFCALKYSNELMHMKDEIIQKKLQILPIYHLAEVARNYRRLREIARRVCASELYGYEHCVFVLKEGDQPLWGNLRFANQTSTIDQLEATLHIFGDVLKFMHLINYPSFSTSDMSIFDLLHKYCRGTLVRLRLDRIRFRRDFDSSSRRTELFDCLQSFKIDDCDLNGNRLFGPSPQLITLDIDLKALATFSAGVTFPRLKKLRLQIIESLSERNESIADFLYQHQHVKSVTILGTCRIVFEIMSSNESLTCLYIRYSKNPQHISEFLSKFASTETLQELALHECRPCTDHDYNYLRYLNRFRNLRTLYVNVVTDCPSWSLSELHDLTKLQELTWISTNRRDDIVQLVERLPELEQISVCYTSIDDNAFTQLCALYQRRARVLSLHIIVPIKKLYRLKNLDEDEGALRYVQVYYTYQPLDNIQGFLKPMSASLYLSHTSINMRYFRFLP